jgi:hypothetical protein
MSTPIETIFMPIEKVVTPKFNNKGLKFMTFGFWLSEQLHTKNIINDELRDVIFKELFLFSEINEKNQFYDSFLNNINDIQKSTDHSELNLLSSEISKIMIDIVLAKKGIGGVFRKYTHSALKKNAPDFYLELNCATKQAVLFANKEPILKIAREILAGLGGELKDGFKMFLPDGKRLPLNTSQGSVV